MNNTIDVAAPSQADFQHIRQSVLFYLAGVEKGSRTDVHLLREAIARTEWKTIDRERRIWALGSAAGDTVAFDDAADLAQRKWAELEPELRKVLAQRIMRWVRQH